MGVHKDGRLDLLNILKYFMVLVFIGYIVFLLSRESADDVPIKTLEENTLAVISQEGMDKGTTQDLKRFYGLNVQDLDGAALYIPMTS